MGASGDRRRVQAVDRALGGLDGDQVPDGSDAAVALLWGQIRREQGSYGEAADYFRKAGKKSSDPGFQATAEFLRIEALEAAGRDEEAARD